MWRVRRAEHCRDLLLRSAATSSRVASTIGSVKTAPVEARIAFGFHGSASASATSERVGAGGVGGARHRAEVAGLLDPDGDEEQRRVRPAAPRGDLDDGEHAFRLGAVAHLASTRALTSSPPCGQSASNSGAK